MARLEPDRALATIGSMGPIVCRICNGPCTLHLVGHSTGPTSADFAPTNHRLGEHADLYRCVHCGTVQQPALPSGEALNDLYRDMADTAYLAEEDGRRTTAARLLDLIGRHVPAGVLLDVGSGHGLLLDEARRRGYATVGIELSAAASAYARDALGLDCRQQSLAAFVDDYPAESLQVIVLADVLEHLDDPVGAIDACQRLLAPGGALCIVTPDPSSRTARLAGKRWWGYVPAHTCLLPHLTLLEIVAARGLVVSEDVPFVRTFTARYWAAGLAERSGTLASIASAVSRTAFGGLQVSLSLHDERAVLVHKLEVEKAPTPLLRDRGHERSVHVVLPAYKAAQTIPQVASSIPTDAADRALLVDDDGPDDTAAVALAEGFDVLRHPTNRGYGANQKTCYVRALRDGADAVVMVHADNQYDPALVAQMVKPIEAGIADAVMGSRLLEDETIAGGMPRWKWFGNRFLTTIENHAFRRGYSEYHTGYRAYSADLLRSIPFLRNSDGFVFDQEIFAQMVASRARVIELSIPTRYFLEASTVSFRSSVGYGLRTLLVLIRFRLDKRRGTWPLLRPPAAKIDSDASRNITAVATNPATTTGNS
jgi:SAM-dependent methyltransferase